MFDISKLALKLPNFLTNEECDGLINEFEQRKEEASNEGSYHASSHKLVESSYQIVKLLPRSQNFNLIREKTKLAIDIWINYLDQPKYFYTKILKEKLKFSQIYRIMKYEKGSYIHPHTDHEIGTYGSISFNLNNDYKGGEFKFFNGNYEIKLNKGDVLIFPADYFWVHEVTPITEGVRYSLNSFLIDMPYPSNKTSSHLRKIIGEDQFRNSPPEELLGPYN